MKNIITKSIIVGLSFSALVSCKKWLEPTPKSYDSPLTQITKDEAYYKALRDYKAGPHSVAFGWFSEWGEGGASTSSMLQAVPDSMDIISLWNNAHLTVGKSADLKFVTEVKGTKVLICSFIKEIGDMYTPAPHNATLEAKKAYYGWKDGDNESIHSAIAKYTKNIADSLNAYGFSGIDIDYEPGEYGGPLCRNAQYFTWFVEEMGKYIGPQSGTKKIFVVDGYFWNIPTPEVLGKYFDYFVEQAYKSSSPNALESRLSSHYTPFSSLMSKEEFTNKFIVTDNLESAIDCLNGGYPWTDANNHAWDKAVMPSLVGYADWKPKNGFRKGGFGAYRFSNENVNNPPYKWMRRAIQQQNPSPGHKIITAK